MKPYTPISGPALHKIHAKRKQRTGCPGISYVEVRTRGQRFYSVCLGANRTRRFRIFEGQKNEAWRRAVKCRADYELAATRSNQAILLARKANS